MTRNNDKKNMKKWKTARPGENTFGHPERRKQSFLALPLLFETILPSLVMSSSLMPVSVREILLSISIPNGVYIDNSYKTSGINSPILALGWGVVFFM